jgi:hypothetical protein
MELPVGMLIYWASRFEDDHAVISGMWYYKEMVVPSTVAEKKQSVLDLKAKRCTVLNIHGTFDQVLDLLVQSDRFQKMEETEIQHFNKLTEEMLNPPDNKASIFDEVYRLKGTSLMIDTVVDIDETIEDITAQHNAGKAICVRLSEKWSFTGELVRSFGIK